MKLLRFAPILFLLAACNDAPHVSEMANMPTSELALIKKFNAADSAYSLDDNAIKKSEALKYHQEAIVKFIADTLHKDAKQWLGVLNKIDASQFSDGVFEVTILIPKNNYLEEKNPESNTIRLNAKIDSNITVKNSLKEMKAGDKIIVSGTFAKGVLNDVDFTGTAPNPSYTFSDPQFDFNIESISKRK